MTETNRAPIDWAKLILASVIGGIVMILGQKLVAPEADLISSLGSMLMPDGGSAMQYGAGAVMHLGISIAYGVLYAFVIAPLGGTADAVRNAVKAGLFGLLLVPVAFFAMPLMASMLPGGNAAGNPCNPCGGAASNPCNPCSGKAANPCNPCAGKAENPCNPCAEAGNPCNPCADAENPCNPCSNWSENPCNPCAAKAASNPCGGAVNPCNPCAGGSSGIPWASIIGHLLYGLALGLIYRPKATA